MQKMIRRTPYLGNSSWKSHAIAEIPQHLGRCAALHGATSKHLSSLSIATSYSILLGRHILKVLPTFSQEVRDWVGNNEITTESGYPFMVSQTSPAYLQFGGKKKHPSNSMQFFVNVFALSW